MSMFLRGISQPLSFNPDDPKSRSVTHQSFAKDANINNIMSRYEKTGVLVDPTLVNSKRVARFDDYSDIPDFAVQLERITQAKADFLTFPAAVRARFDNDVANALDFIADASNVEEAVALGFLPKDNPNYVKLLSDRAAAKAAIVEGATKSPSA